MRWRACSSSDIRVCRLVDVRGGFHQAGFPLWSGIRAHGDDVTAVLIDADRKLVISVSYDRDILCWDLRVRRL